MDAYSIIGFAGATAIIAFTVKQYNPQAAVHVAIAGSAVMLLSILALISGVIDEFNMLAGMGGVAQGTVKTIIKAVGVAYMAQFASHLCKDLGESALAVKTEIVGRILLLTLAMPIIRSIAEMLIELANVGL